MSSRYSGCSAPTEFSDPWPLRHLVLRTPRLELRPDEDAGLYELAEVARHGVHPPERTPFNRTWTDAPDERMTRGLVQHSWSDRASLGPTDWDINFLVRVDGRVVGTQNLSGKEFGVRRECLSGSWLGLAHQGNGIGTEMRAAVLMFAFDHLDAVQVRSEAFTDNPVSLRISDKLGYVHDGTTTCSPRNERRPGIRLLLTRERFATHRPEWTLAVDGVEPVLGMLGADRVAVE